jgi:Flp pilus assembly protein TadG
MVGQTTRCCLGSFPRTALVETPFPVASAAAGPRKRIGSAIVEFTVVAPLLVMVIFGIIEFGRTFMVMELLTEAARAGCRKGIVPGTSTQDIKDAVVNSLTNAGISGETATVIINDGAGNIAEAQGVPSYTEITVQVTISVGSVSWLSWFLNPNWTLAGRWTMRRE